MKKLLLLSFLTLHTCLLSAPVNHPTQTDTTSAPAAPGQPSDPVVTQYMPPPPRNLAVFLDDGSENPYGWLFGRETKPASAITDNFINALYSEDRTPIFVSGPVFASALARKIIANDFTTLSDEELTQKYGAEFDTQNSYSIFKDKSARDAMKAQCKLFQTGFDAIKNVFEAYKATPNQQNLKTLQNTVQSVSTSLQNSNWDTYFDFFQYHALDFSQWSLYENTNGFLLLPKDAQGEIVETGLNISIFSTNDRASDLPAAFSRNPSFSLLKRTKSSPDSAIKNEIVNLIEITNQKHLWNHPEEYAPLNIYLIGHGAPKTESFNGSLVNVSLNTINKTLIPALEENYTKTCTYNTCFGGDINADRTFGKAALDTGLSFSTLSATPFATESVSTSFSFLNNIEVFCKEQSELLQQNIAPEPTQIPSINSFLGGIDNAGTYFANLEKDPIEAATTLFTNGSQDIIGYTITPFLLPAGKTDWITLDSARKDMLNISNMAHIQERTKAAYNIPFEYSIASNGGLYLGNQTIVAPIHIHAEAQLPFILPVSIGTQTHYIKELVLEDPSIKVTEFIEKSIKPFFNAANEANAYGTNIAQKTIVIDSLTCKEGNITLVATPNGAYYTIASAKKTLFGSDRIYSMDFARTPFTWGSTKIFRDALAQGRKNAAAEMVKIETLQNIETTVRDRQKTLLLIQQLVAYDPNYSLQNDLSKKSALQDAITHAIALNNNQSLSDNLLLHLSLQELVILYEGMHSMQESFSLEPFKQTLENVTQELKRQQLLNTLSKRSLSSTDAVLNWYLTLDAEEQILIKYEVYATLEGSDLLSRNVHQLTNRERELLKGLVEETLLMATASTQITLLKQQLDTLSQPRNAAQFEQYLHEQVNNKLSIPALEDSLIDFIAALDHNEKALIQEDLEVYFLQKVLDASIQKVITVDSLSANELALLSEELQEFLISPDNEKNKILEKLSSGGTTINEKNFQATLQSTIEDIQARIIQKLTILTADEQTELLDPESGNLYSQIFRNLSLAQQKEVIKRCPLLKNAPDDVLAFQKIMIDQRIKKAQTTIDLKNLEADIKAAGIPDTAVPSSFTARFTELQTAENKALAAGTPVKEELTQPITITPEAIEPIIPEAPTTSSSGTPQEEQPSSNSGTTPVIKDSLYKDAALEEEWKKEQEQKIADEKVRQEEAKIIEEKLGDARG